MLTEALAISGVPDGFIGLVQFSGKVWLCVGNAGGSSDMRWIAHCEATARDIAVFRRLNAMLPEPQMVDSSEFDLDADRLKEMARAG